MTLSSISTPLLGIVDTALLGHLGSAHYLAAVAIGANFIGVLFWSFGFLRMGTTGQVAQEHGKRLHDEHDADNQVSAIVFRAIAVGAVLGICFTLFAPLFAPYIISWMNASEQAAPLAREYITIRCYSALWYS